MPKELIVHPSIEAAEMADAPIPIPKDKEVVIKVVAAASNPKDWKFPHWKNWPHNSGDDMAGIVHSVGKDVYEFKPGDRVAALHQAEKENGSYAEYSVALDWTTFHIPQNVTFEEGATIPVAALTAAVALYSDMKLPMPQDGPAPAAGNNKRPILIYGVTSAVGAFAAKLARLSGLRPIIGVAGRAGDYAQTLADYVVDYRRGEDAVVRHVEEILEKEGLGSKIMHVFDAISEGGTLETTLRFLDTNGGVVGTVLPPDSFARDKENFKYPPGVTAFHSYLPVVHSTRKDFGYLWSRYLGRLLEDGRLKAHPFEVVPGGLNGVLTGLQKLRDGKASAVKYVYRIEDTDDSLPTYPTPPPSSARTEPHPLANVQFPSII
ncbi:putative alcohol dehydrogenase-like protein [Rosellinia necatrix]|uniref:Putative alcohol dehydrogenase-like protein n=1 Tax=Rosellinia necatrix TaxID=77044 RepID=A0A1S7UMI2_ROSNE|nr:putative alcohol dehydrogenase-like protein [Rosellinia necatrix]